jgi:hypothetical protein
MSSYRVIDANVASSHELPYFSGALNNVTVSVGRDATFTCNVKNLKLDLKKGYQVNKMLISFNLF